MLSLSMPIFVQKRKFAMAHGESLYKAILGHSVPDEELSEGGPSRVIRDSNKTLCDIFGSADYTFACAKFKGGGSATIHSWRDW
jgi:hypothetical protein